MAQADGVIQEQTLRQAGYVDADIAQWKQETTGQLTQAGYSPSEVGEYFGAPAGTPSDLAPGVHQNLKDHLDERTPEGGGPVKATTFGDAFLAGIQGSSGGLIARQKMPDVQLPPDASLGMKIVAASGQMAGDLPAMVAGGVFGAAAGSEVPILGNAVGAAAGAFAMPAMLRRSYIDDIQKGAIKDFPDYFSRLAAVTWDGIKGGMTGAITHGAGGMAGEALATAGVSAGTQLGGTLATELATMTTVGKAMEGEVPKPEDFLIGAVTLAGLHGAMHVVGELPSAAKDIQTKLQNTYAETGLKPQEVVTAAATDPVLKQQLLAEGDGVPAALWSMSSPEFKKQWQEIDESQIPPGLNDEHPTLNGKEFDQTPTPKIPSDFESEHFDYSDSGSKKPPEPPKEGEPPGEPPPSDRDTILSRIGEQGEAKAPKWDNWYTRTVDKLNPVFQWTKAVTEGTEVHSTEDPYAVISTALSRGFARANEAIESGPVDFETGKPTGGKGFKDIVEPFKDDPQGFKAYLIAKRAIGLEQRGIDSGVPLESARRYVEEHGDKYEKSSKELVEFQNSGVKYLKDSGYLTDEQYQQIITENQDYIPFRRVLDEGASGTPGGTKPIKEIRGSERQIIDPYESIIKNQFAYYKLAEQNAGKQTVVDLAREFEAPKELFDPVPQTSKPITASDEEVEKWMKDNEIQGSESGAAPGELTLWRPMSLPLADNEFAVMENGERKVYKVDESLAKALSATAYKEPNVLMKIAGIFAKAQHIGVTENPFFLLTHAVRDQFSASIYSQNGYRFAYDGMRGMFHQLFGSEQADEFFRQGGGMATMADFDEKYVKNDIWGLSKETGLLDKTTNVIKTPLRLMHALAQLVFTAPKMGEYLRATEAGKDPFSAMIDARNVTPDVQQRGSSALVQAWSAATPFFSMRIRGMDQMVQAFKDDPTGTGTKMGLAIALPSLVTWMAFKDDDRYKNAANWEKDLYWLLPLGGPGGPTMRIPKPFEPGLLFGSLLERTLQEFYDKKPEAFKGFGQALLGSALPNVVPPVAMPALEQFANRSWLTGGQIVPHSLEGISPAYQYNAYTTETAKILGKMIASVPGVSSIGRDNVTVASPMVIENYVRAWGGTMGTYALHLADKALETAGVAPAKALPTATLADLPFVKAYFARYPSGGAQPIQDFYDNFEKAQTRSKTIEHLEKTGQGQQLQSYMTSNEYSEHVFRMSGIEKALNAQNKMVSAIYSNPQIPPDAKRQQIDGLYYMMINEAKQGNAAMHQMDETMKGRR